MKEILLKKRKVILISFIILVILAIAIPVSIHIVDVYKIKYPYTQEYIVGTGNIKGRVKVERFKEYGEAYEIGATAEGFAVFKDPRLAFKTLKKQYKEEIKEIREKYDLGPLSQFNYEKYVVTLRAKGSDSPVFHILNIYDNSFIEIIPYPTS